MNRVPDGAAGSIAATPAVAVTESIDVRLDAPTPISLAVVAKSGDVVAGASADGPLRLWDAKTGALRSVIDTHGRQPAWLGFSHDDRLMLVADYARRVTMSTVTSGAITWEFTPHHYLLASAFSPDDRLLAVAPGSPVQLYDVESHGLLRQLEPTIGTLAVAFSRDGSMLASADGDAVRIFDVPSGRLIAENTESIAAPLAVAFSADDRFLIAGGGDRVLLLIDATNGKTIGRSASVSDPIMYLETSPDGAAIAAVTQNADDTRRSAPVVLATLPDLTFVRTWAPPTGVILPGASWGTDGLFRFVTQSGSDLHFWTVR